MTTCASTSLGLRERFLAAMRRESEDWVPKNIHLCPAQMERFRAAYGHSDVAGQWGLPTRGAELPFRATAADFSRWHPELPAGARIDAWGIGHVPASDGSHFERLLHPLAGERSAAEVAGYPFPEPAGAEDVARLAARVAEIHSAGFASAVAVAPVGGTVFWPAYKLRGMEALLCDMLAEPEAAGALLDAVTGVCEAQARLAASARPDLLMLADDLGTQRSTYMSPELFRQWLKPRLARVIAAAREAHPDMLVHFHSDGQIAGLIPDLVEIGVDILNPVQPECMDAIEIKRRFGRELSFSGCIGTQTTLPFGSPEDVRAAVRLACREVGRGGGLWVAPTHLVEPEVPWENVLAFVEAAGEFGGG